MIIMVKMITLVEKKTRSQRFKEVMSEVGVEGILYGGFQELRELGDEMAGKFGSTGAGNRCQTKESWGGGVNENLWPFIRLQN